MRIRCTPTILNDEYHNALVQRCVGIWGVGVTQEQLDRWNAMKDAYWFYEFIDEAPAQLEFDLRPE